MGHLSFIPINLAPFGLENFRHELLLVGIPERNAEIVPANPQFPIGLGFHDLAKVKSCFWLAELSEF